MSSELTVGLFNPLLCNALGMGVGAVYIPAFLDVLRYCLTRLHYPDDVGTYGLLSGLLTSSLCLGSSIGSAAGAYMTNGRHLRGYMNIKAFLLHTYCVVCAMRGISEDHNGDYVTIDVLSTTAILCRFKY